MKITGPKPIVQLDPKVQSAQDNGKNPHADPQEKVSVSRQARDAMRIDVDRIREDLEQVPEVRADKVAQIKEALEKGTYAPPADKVAEKMISTHLVESLYRKA